MLVKNIQETEKVAKKLLPLIKEKKVIAFHGSMGSGKTTLIKMICRLLECTDNVSSPTFSLVNEYINNKGEKIYHMDFYRIKSSEEAFQIGLEDYFADEAYTFIEWPEKIKELLPSARLDIQITITGNKERRINLI